MPRPKPGVLPLDDTPVLNKGFYFIINLKRGSI